MAAFGRIKNCRDAIEYAAEPLPAKPSLSEEGAPKGRVMGRECEDVASFAWHSQSPRVTTFLRLQFVCTSDTAGSLPLKEGGAKRRKIECAAGA